MHHLFRGVKAIVCSTNIAASTAENAGSIIDTRGFRGLAFVGLLGALTTATAGHLHAEGGSATATTDMVDIEASAVSFTDAIQGAALVLDLGRPKFRYYRPVLGSTAAANSAVSAVLGLLYNPVYSAVTHDTGTVAGSTYLTNATTGASTGS